MNILYIGIAGSLGALARFLLSSISMVISPSIFPWGTLICNIVGTWLMVFLAYSLLQKVHETIRQMVLVGFLGSFTTFSAFSYEVLHLFLFHHHMLAIIYISVSISGGCFAAWLGYRLAKRFTS